ncbi:phospho-sugar mutase [Zafaria sp. J156]|uniref:phospho-sugar mutase n=1 Tax=Zafaria sp. J156 TaxID=3116490 RepID=UPI002E790931|nr:phospho-sugar mutase [Zafaria sp. J156]MEE1619980.1 phospho-sugar mutase [Zafaria sp. J156]
MNSKQSASPFPPEPGRLAAVAEAWAATDPDPATAAELRALAAEQDLDGEAGEIARAELSDRFAGTLEFGTAGLRAALGAGPNRMNRVVVRRTAAGLARFLLETAAGAYVPSVVVGFDARHNSDVFALDTAAVLTAAGIEAFLMPGPLPTPVLAWAVREHGCEAGVMVTASHNPPQDNGYKVYLGGRAVGGSGQGAQIVAPLDAEIASHISYDGPLEDIALADSGWTVLPGAGADGDVQARYIEAVSALLPAPDAETARARAGLRIVLTPLHGVGGDTMVRVFERAGFTQVHLVEQQAAPDPDFPTVSFPNPEEAGALDLALARAGELDADLVVANDPDADRCALAVEFADGPRMLRGDETGALLGAYLAARFAPAAGDGGGTTPEQGPRPVFANSVVSSRLLSRIAASHGIEHTTTLTGFKWIARVPDLVYGYEEALGYCVAPELVRDKDGISAALLLADLAANLKAEGRGIPDALDQLALVHGLFATDQLSVRVHSLDLLGAMMGRLRAQPPESFGGSDVVEALDLAEGTMLPPTDGLLYLTADDTRVIIRPSGTEPKLKCYLEVVAPVYAADSLEDARATARARLDAVLADVNEALGL